LEIWVGDLEIWFKGKIVIGVAVDRLLTQAHLLASIAGTSVPVSWIY
jgi:hypothetical protein